MLTETVAGRTYDYSHTVGRQALTGMGFNFPVGMAKGKDEVVYVLNRGGEGVSNVPWNKVGYGARIGIVKLGTQPNEEEFLGEFSKYGDANGEYIWGSGMVTDSQEKLYVLDEWLNRVTVFDKDGNFLSHWDTVEASDSGPNGSASIAMDKDENIYITDGRSHKVKRFTRDGKLLATWGTHGSAQGELDSPWGITLDNQGFVYVADFKNHRVQKFTPEGDFVAQFGSHGDGPGQMTYPVDVTVDPEGDVYICDWSENGWEQGKVHIFDKDGKYITSLIGDSQVLSHWAQMTVDANDDYGKRRREVATTEPEWRFAQPAAVEYDADHNRLLVVDTQRSRIQIYNKQIQYMVPQLNL